MSQFHQHIYTQLLHMQIPKVQNSVKLLVIFVRYLDLGAKKLHIKCWLNWPQVDLVLKSDTPEDGSGAYTVKLVATVS